MNTWKQKLKIQCHLQSMGKKKYLGTNLRCARFTCYKLQNADEKIKDVYKQKDILCL